ncbi:hypothetical protein IT568_04570 [bacterium]|nr:hypothetical protein [bacterium]
MDKKRKIFVLALILSLLIHFGFFYLPMNQIFAVQTSPKQIEETKTIAFTFKKPNEKQEEMLVRNENYNEEKIETNLLALKNSKAKDQEKVEDLTKSNLPFAKGEQKEILDFTEIKGEKHLIPQKQSKQFAEAQKNSNPNSKVLRGSKPLAESSKSIPFTAEMLTNANPSATGSGLFRQPKFDNQGSFLGDYGLLSLSTKEWKWADYFERFLDKVGEGWQAPSGYVSPFFFFGHTVENFSVQKDGTVRILETSEIIGHQSFEFSSEQALKNVKIPLPTSFPDDSLVVSIKMIYPETIYHKQRQKEWEDKFGPQLKTNNPIIKKAKEQSGQ